MLTEEASHHGRPLCGTLLCAACYLLHRCPGHYPCLDRGQPILLSIMLVLQSGPATPLACCTQQCIPLHLFAWFVCSLCRTMRLSLLQPENRCMTILGSLCVLSSINNMPALNANIMCSCSAFSSSTLSPSKLCVPAVCGAGVPENPHPNSAAPASELHAPLPPAQAHPLHGSKPLGSQALPASACFTCTASVRFALHS